MTSDRARDVRELRHAVWNVTFFSGCLGANLVGIFANPDLMWAHIAASTVCVLVTLANGKKIDAILSGIGA